MAAPYGSRPTKPCQTERSPGIPCAYAQSVEHDAHSPLQCFERIYDSESANRLFGEFPTGLN